MGLIPAGPLLDLRVEVVPVWPFRMPRLIGMDGVTRRRHGVLQRLLHVDGDPVVVRIARLTSGNVLFGAQAAHRTAAAEAIARMRFALGVDDDLAPFHRAFRDDPVIGASVRAQPWLRVTRRPEPFEALAWAICEQLIEYERAAAIERRIVFRLGPQCEQTGLRDVPDAAVLAGVAPARFQAWDLSAGRALALTRVAREVARGRIDLRSPDHECAWRRLRAIPGIGAWTVEMLALHGQGRYDQVPAADVGFLKHVGRWNAGGDPYARATEDEVREFFAPYGAWAGLAAAHALAVRPPVRARTRWSARPGRAAA